MGDILWGMENKQIPIIEAIKSELKEEEGDKPKLVLPAQVKGISKRPGD